MTIWPSIFNTLSKKVVSSRMDSSISLDQSSLIEMSIWDMDKADLLNAEIPGQQFDLTQAQDGENNTPGFQLTPLKQHNTFESPRKSSLSADEAKAVLISPPPKITRVSRAGNGTVGRGLRWLGSMINAANANTPQLQAAENMTTLTEANLAVICSKLDEGTRKSFTNFVEELNNIAKIATKIKSKFPADETITPFCDELTTFTASMHTLLVKTISALVNEPNGDEKEHVSAAFYALMNTLPTEKITVALAKIENKLDEATDTMTKVDVKYEIVKRIKHINHLIEGESSQRVNAFQLMNCMNQDFANFNKAFEQTATTGNDEDGRPANQANEPSGRELFVFFHKMCSNLGKISNIFAQKLNVNTAVNNTINANCAAITKLGKAIAAPSTPTNAVSATKDDDGPGSIISTFGGRLQDLSTLLESVQTNKASAAMIPQNSHEISVEDRETARTTRTRLSLGLDGLTRDLTDIFSKIPLLDAEPAEDDSKAVPTSEKKLSTDQEGLVFASMRRVSDLVQQSKTQVSTEHGTIANNKSGGLNFQDTIANILTEMAKIQTTLRLALTADAFQTPAKKERGRSGSDDTVGSGLSDDLLFGDDLELLQITKDINGVTYTNKAGTWLGPDGSEVTDEALLTQLNKTETHAWATMESMVPTTPADSAEVGETKLEPIENYQEAKDAAEAKMKDFDEAAFNALFPKFEELFQKTNALQDLEIPSRAESNGEIEDSITNLNNCIQNTKQFVSHLVTTASIIKGNIGATSDTGTNAEAEQALWKTFPAFYGYHLTLVHEVANSFMSQLQAAIDKINTAKKITPEIALCLKDLINLTISDHGVDTAYSLQGDLIRYNGILEELNSAKLNNAKGGSEKSLMAIHDDLYFIEDEINWWTTATLQGERFDALVAKIEAENDKLNVNTISPTEGHLLSIGTYVTMLQGLEPIESLNNAPRNAKDGAASKGEISLFNEILVQIHGLAATFSPAAEALNRNANADNGFENRIKQMDDLVKNLNTSVSKAWTLASDSKTPRAKINYLAGAVLNKIGLINLTQQIKSTTEQMENFAKDDANIKPASITFIGSIQNCFARFNRALENALKADAKTSDDPTKSETTDSQPQSETANANGNTTAPSVATGSSETSAPKHADHSDGEPDDVPPPLPTRAPSSIKLNALDRMKYNGWTSEKFTSEFNSLKDSIKNIELPTCITGTEVTGTHRSLAESQPLDKLDKHDLYTFHERVLDYANALIGAANMVMGLKGAVNANEAYDASAEARTTDLSEHALEHLMVLHKRLSKLADHWTKTIGEQNFDMDGDSHEIHTDSITNADKLIRKLKEGIPIKADKDTEPTFAKIQIAFLNEIAKLQDLNFSVDGELVESKLGSEHDVIPAKQSYDALCEVLNAFYPLRGLIKNAAPTSSDSAPTSTARTTDDATNGATSRSDADVELATALGLDDPPSTPKLDATPTSALDPVFTIPTSKGSEAHLSIDNMIRAIDTAIKGFDTAKPIVSTLGDTLDLFPSGTMSDALDVAAQDAKGLKAYETFLSLHQSVTRYLNSLLSLAKKINSKLPQGKLPDRVAPTPEQMVAALYYRVSAVTIKFNAMVSVYLINKSRESNFKIKHDERDVFSERARHALTFFPLGVSKEASFKKELNENSKEIGAFIPKFEFNDGEAKDELYEEPWAPSAERFIQLLTFKPLKKLLQFDEINVDIVPELTPRKRKQTSANVASAGTTSSTASDKTDARDTKVPAPNPSANKPSTVSSSFAGTLNSSDYLHQFGQPLVRNIDEKNVNQARSQQTVTALVEYEQEKVGAVHELVLDIHSFIENIENKGISRSERKTSGTESKTNAPEKANGKLENRANITFKFLSELQTTYVNSASTAAAGPKTDRLTQLKEHLIQIASQLGTKNAELGNRQGVESKKDIEKYVKKALVKVFRLVYVAFNPNFKDSIALEVKTPDSNKPVRDEILQNILDGDKSVKKLNKSWLTDSSSALQARDSKNWKKCETKATKALAEIVDKSRSKLNWSGASSTLTYIKTVHDAAKPKNASAPSTAAPSSSSTDKSTDTNGELNVLLTPANATAGLPMQNTSDEFIVPVSIAQNGLNLPIGEEAQNKGMASNLMAQQTYGDAWSREIPVGTKLKTATGTRTTTQVETRSERVAYSFTADTISSNGDNIVIPEWLTGDATPTASGAGKASRSSAASAQLERDISKMDTKRVCVLLRDQFKYLMRGSLYREKDLFVVNMTNKLRKKSATFSPAETRKLKAILAQRVKNAMQVVQVLKMQAASTVHRLKSEGSLYVITAKPTLDLHLHFTVVDTTSPLKSSFWNGEEQQRLAFEHMTRLFANSSSLPKIATSIKEEILMDLAKANQGTDSITNDLKGSVFTTNESEEGKIAIKDVKLAINVACIKNPIGKSSTSADSLETRDKNQAYINRVWNPDKAKHVKDKSGNAIPLTRDVVNGVMHKELVSLYNSIGQSTGSRLYKAALTQAFSYFNHRATITTAKQADKGVQHINALATVFISRINELFNNWKIKALDKDQCEQELKNLLKELKALAMQPKKADPRHVEPFQKVLGLSKEVSHATR